MIICVAELLLCEPIQRKVSTLIIDKESWNIIQCGSNSKKKSRKIGSCVTFDQKSTDDMWQEIFLDHCLEEILLDEQTENQVRAQRLFHHVWRNTFGWKAHITYIYTRYTYMYISKQTIRLSGSHLFTPNNGILYCQTLSYTFSTSLPECKCQQFGSFECQGQLHLISIPLLNKNKFTYF